MSRVITPDQVHVGQKIVLTHSVCGVVESIDYPFCTICTIGGVEYSLVNSPAEGAWTLKIALVQDRLPLPNRWVVVWYRDGTRVLYWINRSLRDRADEAQLLTACLGPQKTPWSIAINNAADWEEFTEQTDALEAITRGHRAFEDRR